MAATRVLISVYKVLFGTVTVDHSEMFTVTHHIKQGTPMKTVAYSLSYQVNLRKHFFLRTCLSSLELIENYVCRHTVQSVATFKSLINS